MDATTYKKLTEKQLLGREVRTLIKMQNGYGVIPEGTICKITRKFQGYSLTTAKCGHCGMQIRISRVHRRDVQLLPRKEQEK